MIYGRNMDVNFLFHSWNMGANYFDVSSLFPGLTKVLLIEFRFWKKNACRLVFFHQRNCITTTFAKSTNFRNLRKILRFFVESISASLLKIIFALLIEDLSKIFGKIFPELSFKKLNYRKMKFKLTMIQTKKMKL